MDPSMRISPKYKVRDWCNLTFSTEKDWQEAVDIFEDRIRGRFLKHVTCIEKREFAGFAVLALDCLLIETLQQFREGCSETPPRKANEYFVKFLTETSFRDCFKKELAKMFYDQIRCGILHQAQVKGTSRVRIDPGLPLVKKTEDGTGLVINRKLFHEQLEKVFEEYAKQLRSGGDCKLREDFRRKMNYICGISSHE